MAVLQLPVPALVLGENQVRGWHWAKVRREMQPWRDAAFYVWKQNRTKESVLCVMGVPCNIRLTLPFNKRRRRDPHNYVGTVVKAVVDGLVLAGAWPDDTPEWVTVLEPRLVVHERVPDANLSVEINIEPRSGNG